MHRPRMQWLRGAVVQGDQGLKQRPPIQVQIQVQRCGKRTPTHGHACVGRGNRQGGRAALKEEGREQPQSERHKVSATLHAPVPPIAAKSGNQVEGAATKPARRSERFPATPCERFVPHHMSAFWPHHTSDFMPHHTSDFVPHHASAFGPHNTSDFVPHQRANSCHTVPFHFQ
eukprot:90318-Chlamydomonas_euryale.AAC.3